ncbi:MAG TPA: PrsW family glutamic-type intramembrane protease [Dongiaceae bacterium]
MEISHGFPPVTSAIAVLVCAAILGGLYQYLFPRPARWPLVGIALVLGGSLTVSLTYLLSPTKNRLAEIHDLWSALRVVVLTVGLPEEGVKFTGTVIALLIFGLAIARPRGVTAAEAFQASLFSALGFAVVENMLYAKAFAEASLVIAIGRGIIASFIHGLMAMIQGIFLARFVATGYRRWHLPVIGYLCAAACHAGFDWGMLQPLAKYLDLTAVHADPATIEAEMAALISRNALVLVIGIPAPFIVGLWCLRRSLRHAGAGDPRNAEPWYQARLARWRRAGTWLLVPGVIGVALVIVGVVVLTVSGIKPQPSAGATPDLASADLSRSLLSSAALVLPPMAVVFGWLLRQKR